MSNCEMVASILGKTDDGRRLYQTPREIERHGRNGDGTWLYFLQGAVNGELTPKGEAVVRVFYNHVIENDWDYSFETFVKRFKDEIESECLACA